MDIDDTAPAIEAIGLRCRYGQHEAVRGINLRVERGELFALLGTNGAGKTTTMETLEGHRRADDGQVRVLGHDPQRDRAIVRPRVGIMLQESGFAAELSVRETLELWRALRRRGGDVTDVLERLDLGHRCDVGVGVLSGGERRRLDLALAVLGDPEVLFLDEPTTGLDPESRRRTWDVVRDLLRGGTTVLLTTHYLEEAEALADRLAILHDGRIAVSGTPKDVLAEHPARITFELPSTAPELPDLAGSVRRMGPTTIVHTPALQDDLTTLLGWAAGHRVVLDRLAAAPASLDEVFHAVRRGEITPVHDQLEVAA